MSPSTRTKSTKPKKPKKRTAAKSTVRAKASTPKRRVRVSKEPGPSTESRRRRRAVFVDVENTSSEIDLMRVLEALAIDRAAQPTELTAVGNWRTVGQRLGRRLASLGAQLVHSAPATGVRDWSDLWIAVAAGLWLGRAEPGDALEIVSDDRAFDAVGDAAAAIGVTFRRISHRTTGRPAAEHAAAPVEPSGRRSHRGGRRGRGRRPQPGAPHAAPRVVHPSPSVTPAAASHEEAHPASHDQIAAVMTRLSGGNPERWINLDVLANALKGEGFTRPPGSPRLVTRLHKLKDLEVSPNGMVRLVAGGRAASHAAPDAASTPEPAAPRRSRRRGGRGRRRREPSGEMSAPEAPAEPPVVDSPAD